MRSLLAALALLCAAALPAQAAGFDCAKAATATETAICADPALSAADGKLGAAYAAALKQVAGDARDALVQAQRGWLKTRNACKVDTACLTAEYRTRLAALAPAAAAPAPGRDGFAALSADDWAMAMARAAEAGAACDTPLQLESVMAATPSWPKPCPYLFEGPDLRQEWRYSVHGIARIRLPAAELYILAVEYYGARLNHWSELYLVRADGSNGTVAVADDLEPDAVQGDAALLTLTLLNDQPGSPRYGEPKGSRRLRATAEGVAPLP